MSKWKYIRLLLFVLALVGFAHFLAYAAITDFDFRERGQSPVAIEVVTVTLDFDVDPLVGTATIAVNGRAEQIVITVPDLNVTGAGIRFRLKDENGVVLGQTPDNDTDPAIYSNLISISSNVYRPSSTILLSGTTTIEVETDAAQTEDNDIEVQIYLR